MPPSTRWRSHSHIHMGRGRALLLLLIWLALPAGLSAATLAPVAGRTFGVEDKLKLKLEGFDNVKGLALALVAFGPSEELVADEVQMVIDDGETVVGVSGTYSLNENGRPVIELDPEELADLLEAVFIELGEPDEGLSLEIAIKEVEAKAKAKAKQTEPEDKFKLRVFLRFNIILSGEEGSAKVKAKLIFEGTGREVGGEAGESGESVEAGE